MSLFVESIKVHQQRFHNLLAHQERLNQTRLDLLGCTEEIELTDYLSISSQLDMNTTYKCRLLYSERIESITFQPYHPKTIQSLQLVYCDSIQYKHKLVERSTIQFLYQLKPDYCDDILIVKNGLISDASYANVIFFDGKQWFTPATPLLAGTKRRQLIAAGFVQERFIRPDDLALFTGAKLINAMLDMEDTNLIPIERIIG